MRVAIAGSHGLIGTALVARLTAGGHEVLRLGRGQPEIAGTDAVVNLAGAGIGDRRWTVARKQVLADSRVAGTRRLAEAMGAMVDGPRVLVNASAVGWYGDRDDEELDETSAPGRGFLADLCRDWEGATQPAADAGARVVLLRSGIVLASAGGALAKQLPLFKIGVGGRLGSGRQYTSWISLPDAVGAIELALTAASIDGPVNVVAPQPVTNAEFTRTLGRVLHRPTVVPVPAFGLRALFGKQMTEEMLLASQRAHPEVLGAAGYRFAHPDLESALRAVCGRPAAGSGAT